MTRTPVSRWVITFVLFVSVASIAMEYALAGSVPYAYAEAAADRIATRGTKQYDDLRDALTLEMRNAFRLALGMHVVPHFVVIVVLVVAWLSSNREGIAPRKLAKGERGGNGT